MKNTAMQHTAFLWWQSCSMGLQTSLHWALFHEAVNMCRQPNIQLSLSVHSGIYLKTAVQAEHNAKCHLFNANLLKFATPANSNALNIVVPCLCFQDLILVITHIFEGGTVPLMDGLQSTSSCPLVSTDV